jgi:ABC-type uncharacterized transport system permease subunit
MQSAIASSGLHPSLLCSVKVKAVRSITLVTSLLCVPIVSFLYRLLFSALAFHEAWKSALHSVHKLL